MKIGVVITTYNSEDYFKRLYESLPINMIDEIVVVNGGDKYLDNYSDVHWLQHYKNYNPSYCRNDGLNFLMERDIDYYFIIEDDMIIKDENIFARYVDTLQASNLGYLCFASTSWGSGSPGARTPAVEIHYKPDISVCFYPNMCNEFTVRTHECLISSGKYNVDFTSMWDVENVYNISKTSHMYGFWWFPDIKDSDMYIENNPEAVTRINDGGKRDDILQIEYKKFKKHTGINVQQIPKLGRQEVINIAKQNYK